MEPVINTSHLIITKILLHCVISEVTAQHILHIQYILLIAANISDKLTVVETYSHY